jgi:hypothetical protein
MRGSLRNSQPASQTARDGGRLFGPVFIASAAAERTQYFACRRGWFGGSLNLGRCQPTLTPRLRSTSNANSTRTPQKPFLAAIIPPGGIAALTNE